MSHEMLGDFTAPQLGWWVECECGWISRSYITRTGAVEAHHRHVEATS